MKKRSVSIAGHQTSISIEEPFWQALRGIAAERGQSLAGLIAAIDGDRPAQTNLSSAIRLAVLAWYQARVQATGPKEAVPLSSE